MNLIAKIQQHGLAGSARKGVGWVWRKLRPRYHQWRFRHAPRYANPTPDELATIERDLRGLGIGVSDYAPPPIDLSNFRLNSGFLRTTMAGRPVASGMRSSSNTGLRASAWIWRNLARTMFMSMLLRPVPPGPRRCGSGGA